MGEKETGAGEEQGVVKTKTKSNQSNDRMDQGGGGAAETDVTNDPETTWESSGQAQGRVRGSGPRDADQGFREGGVSHDEDWDGHASDGISHEDDWDGHAGKLAPDKPGKSEIAIGDPGVNGNIAGEPPGIAIGEPGVNSGIAVTDEGVPAAKPHPQSH